MAQRKRTKGNARKESDDVMHGRSFEGEQYAATEQEQTRQFERTRRHMPDESDEFVTDAELEAREANSSREDEEEP